MRAVAVKMGAGDKEVRRLGKSGAGAAQAWLVDPSLGYSAQVAAAAKTAASKHLTKTSTQKFLLDWYGECGNLLLPGTTSCSHPLCGRVETRRHEFRRCSCCGRVRYCSRSCQSADWRLQHKFACLPLLELYGWAESDTDSMDDETPGMPVGTPGVDA